MSTKLDKAYLEGQISGIKNCLGLQAMGMKVEVRLADLKQRLDRMPEGLLSKDFCTFNGCTITITGSKHDIEIAEILLSKCIIERHGPLIKKESK